MKLALLFAGQGSQKPGMGKDLYEACPAFREAFDQVADQVDFDLKTLCFEGPAEDLNQTRYTQPCLFAFAAGVYALLREEGIVAAAAAGLSLGEYSALHAAGVLDLTTCARTVAFRGRAMEAAAAGIDCGMTAVLSMEKDALQQVCDRVEGIVEICNDNCPGQLVISGEKAAVDQASALAREAGAKRCMPLKVSGPFHTSLMAPAGEALEERFREISFGEMAFPVYFNCLGAPMTGEETIPQLLVRQVQTGVRWRETIRNMARDGIDTVLEIGPGKTLSGLVKKTAPEMSILHLETVAELEPVIRALKGAAI